MLTFVSLLALGLVPLPGLSWEERGAFQVFVLYGHCGSMLLTGGLQLVVARHVSDQIFVGDVRRLGPTYATAALVSLLLHAGTAGLFALVTGASGMLAMAEVAFFGTLGLVWIGMLFLGTLRSYLFVATTFVAGMGASFATAVPLAERLGLPGLLGGFAAGQALIAAVFAARVRAQFPTARGLDAGLLETVARYPSLPFIGLAAAAGIWIDKILYWLGPFSVEFEGGLVSAPLYDNAVFLAYLTVLPSLMLLFIRVEVSFHDRCRRFHAAIRQGADLATIRTERERVRESLETTLIRLVGLQGTATLIAILFAPGLLDVLGIDWVQFYAFRVACLGAFLQVLVMTLLLSMIHLAFYRSALLMMGVYLGVCGGITLAFLGRGVEFAGVGMVAGGLAALPFALPRLRQSLLELDREAFAAFD
jgi:uncharacterized membrane protein